MIYVSLLCSSLPLIGVWLLQLQNTLTLIRIRLFQSWNAVPTAKVYHLQHMHCWYKALPKALRLHHVVLKPDQANMESEINPPTAVFLINQLFFCFCDLRIGVDFKDLKTRYEREDGIKQSAAWHWRKDPNLTKNLSTMFRGKRRSEKAKWLIKTNILFFLLTPQLCTSAAPWRHSWTSWHFS